jgi:hypothetical protein
MHGLWDLSHCVSGRSLAGLPITKIALGYGLYLLNVRFHRRDGTHKEDSIPRLRLGIVFDITVWLELCLKKQFPFH